MLRATLLAALLVALACAPPPEAAPDLVVVGQVYTLAWGEPDRAGRPAADAPHDASGWHPDAEAVAIRDGCVVFIGAARDARARAGPATRVVDLGRATIVPGLVESHAHAAEMGRGMREVSLVGAADEEEAVARVAARAASVEQGRWIVGRGWDEGAWADRYPTLERLSAAVPEHPVLLHGLHGFAAWGNRLAFERAGVGASTADPRGGTILRDADGAPSGCVLNRATALLAAAVPPTPLAEREQEILAGLDELVRSGYVAVHEAGVDAATLAALESLDARGALPLRVYAMLSARDAELVSHWLARGPREGGGRLVVRSLKAFYDGALGSRGARLLADYADRPGVRGLAGAAYGFDRELVAAAMRSGFQVAIHAIGDAANREALDLIAAVRAESPAARSGRHRIEHAQVVHPADVARFAELDVIASMQPPHAMEDKAWAEERLGPERIRGAYAWRSLRAAGARLVLNSDLPGSDHDVFYGLLAAIARRDRALEPERGWYPEQRLTAEEALRAYTVWAAFAGFDEDQGGTIALGRRADLTVLDVDPLQLGERAPERLREGRVRMTIVAGAIAFDRGD